MEHVGCNLCGCDDTVLWGEKEGIKIVRCRRCALVYCNPRPTNEDLKQFYSREYFIEGGYGEDPLRERMYKIEIGNILRDIGPGGRFLDVGCAVGRFLSLLPDTFEKWGTEFSQAAARIGRERFSLNILAGELRHLELPRGYFDIIQMRGVIEHSQNPFEDLVKAGELLKEDGIIRISQLPNISSFCAALFGTGFNQVKPREHLYYFSPATISAMLAKAGYRIVKMSYPYMGTPYESLLRDISGIFTNLLRKKESPPFFGNMMVLHAKRRKGGDE